MPYDVPRVVPDEHNPCSRLVDEAKARAGVILTETREILDRVAEALIDRETLDGGEFESLVLGEEASRAPEGQGQPRPTPFAGVPVSAAASELSKGKPEV